MAPPLILAQPFKSKTVALADPITPPCQTTLLGPGLSQSPDLKEMQVTVASRPVLTKTQSCVQSNSKIADGLVSLYNEPNAETFGSMCKIRTQNNGSRINPDNYHAVERTAASQLPNTDDDVLIEVVQILNAAGCFRSDAITPHMLELEEDYLSLIERHVTISYEWIGTGHFNTIERLALQRQVCKLTFTCTLVNRLPLGTCSQLTGLYRTN